MKKIFLFLFLIVFSFSCFAKKITTKSFYPCTNLTDLNRTYVNEDKKLSRLFSIDSRQAYFITFEFEEKNKLKLIYPTDSGLDSVYFKGKIKKDFFEVYLQRKIGPIPFLYFGWNIEKVRIGQNDAKDLLIQHLQNNFGWILFFAAGDTNEDEFAFKRIENYKELKPYCSNNKWGYSDSTQNIVIEPQYDCVEFCKNKVFRVKQAGKWGLINDKGIGLTSIKYDTIYPFNSVNMAEIFVEDKKGYLDINGNEVIPPIYDEVYFSSNNLIKAMLNQKEGYLDKDGNTIIPLIYDNIGSFENSSSIVFFLKDGKYGYRNMKNIICPPVFDEVSETFTTDLSDICTYVKHNETPYAKVIYKAEPYLLDQEGYLYKYKCVKNIRREFVIFEETKIKAMDLQN